MSPKVRAGRVWDVLYWIAVTLVVVYLAIAYANIEISRAYHPMAVMGAVGGRWFLIFPVLALIAVLRTSYMVRKHPARRVRARIAGCAAVGLTVLCQIGTNSLNTGYRHSVWIEDSRYEIPWEYAPGGTTSPDADGWFVVEVAPDGLTPKHRSGRAETISLTKAATHFEAPSGGLQDGCDVSEFDTTACLLVRDPFIYKITGRTGALPDNPEQLFVGVVELLDGFAVPD
ncbi:hypothetical protein ACRARG_09505 [Pseudooceanicola sp. C21-150M6]|uniref:hypothetical protein n=1 Tax=Pseudooceanicola sp. C21-150M6 TaxID=3434355 RepID=UPI003D7FFFF6